MRALPSGNSDQINIIISNHTESACRMGGQLCCLFGRSTTVVQSDITQQLLIASPIPVFHRENFVNSGDPLILYAITRPDDPIFWLYNEMCAKKREYCLVLTAICLSSVWLVDN